MKWLFVCVVLINAVYFIYNAFFNITLNTQRQTITSQDKNQLVLLKELDAVELKALQDKASVIDTTAQTSTPVLNVENKPPSTTQDIDKIKENDIPEDAGKMNNLCYTLGPFTKVKMDDIRLELEKSYNNQLSFGIETTSAITYYRIYIPPLESKDKIKETLALLDKNNLKDHYVMSIDGRKNAIALGVFKKKDAAEKIAAIAENVGLSTTIEAISNDKNSLYKLHINFQKTHDISKFKEFIKQKNLQSMVCENKG